jgi:hypothetical protein
MIIAGHLVVDPKLRGAYLSAMADVTTSARQAGVAGSSSRSLIRWSRTGS